MEQPDLQGHAHIRGEGYGLRAALFCASFSRQKPDPPEQCPALKQLLKGPEDVPRQLSMLFWPVVAAILHVLNCSHADKVHGNLGNRFGHGRLSWLRSAYAECCAVALQYCALASIAQNFLGARNIYTVPASRMCTGAHLRMRLEHEFKSCKD